MSALFDDAQRFEAHIVVGDTIRHVKDSTNVHVGPGTYSPGMAKSNEFGFVGVSSSKRSIMDPPTSLGSSEHQRYANGAVVRGGVWFYPSPFLRAGPGPGAYSPAMISNEYVRGRTARPTSGRAGRQAWDVRGSEGGIPLAAFRDGFSVSSSMGNSHRMGDFSQVTLRDGVLLLRGPHDGHRSNGIGPGTYDGVSNRQDPLTKRSYNLRAQSSQVRRERSLSFSGTSSSARAYLSQRHSPRTVREAAVGRPDLHLFSSSVCPAGGNTDGRSVSPRRERRSISPASAMLSSMRARAIAEEAAVGSRSGGGSSRSLSPRNSRTRSSRESPRDGRTPWATWGYIETYPASNISRFATRGYRSMSPPPITTRTFDDGAGRASWGGSGKRGTLSSSIRQVIRATSPHSRGRNTVSAPSSPHGQGRGRSSVSSKTRGMGNVTAHGGSSTLSSSSYTYDYFGLAGRKGAWHGLETVTAARAEVGIEEPRQVGQGSEDVEVLHGRVSSVECQEQSQGSTPTSPRSLFPEGVPKKGVCMPPKETRDDMHKYYMAANSSPAKVEEVSLLPHSSPTGPKP